jgi:hypothetical protein
MISGSGDPLCWSRGEEASVLVVNVAPPLPATVLLLLLLLLPGATVVGGTGTCGGVGAKSHFIV